MSNALFPQDVVDGYWAEQDHIYRLEKAVVEFHLAMAGKSDRWVPACGGTERVFLCEGRRFQYCFNPAQHKHAYYDVDRDLVLTDGLERELPAALRY